MKIVHVSTYQTGGAGIAARRLFEAQLHAGLNAHWLVKHKTEDTPNTSEIWEDFNMAQKTKRFLSERKWRKKQAEKLKPYQPLEELFTFPETLWKVENNALLKSADIIHLHWVADFINIPSFFQDIQTPVVWTMHDYSPFLGGYHYPQSKQIEPFCQSNQDLVKQAVVGQNIQLVTPSQYLASAIDKLPFDLAPKVIANCSDTVNFNMRCKEEAKAQLGWSLDKPYILTVAQDLKYPRKGMQLMHEIEETLSEITNIVAVGNHHADRTSISYTGSVNKASRLALMYAAADVFVVPSLDDNFPNTVAEALLCGTPVVGFDLGGISEMINHQKNGLICSNVSGDALMHGLKQALSYNWDHNAIASKAKIDFSARPCLDHYKAIYENCFE